MEAGRGADARGLTLQVGAAGELDVFELLDAGEMAVDQDRVGQRPQVLGGLQLRGVRREKKQVDMLGHPQMDAGVPTRPIQHQDNLLVRTGTRLARERGQLGFKHGDAYRGGQMKEGAPRGGMDEAHQIAPFEPVAYWGNRALANRRPDPAQQRFEANAMFVGGPELHPGVGKGGRHRS